MDIMDDIRAIPSWMWLGGAAALGVILFLKARSSNSSITQSAPSPIDTSGGLLPINNNANPVGNSVGVMPVADQPPQPNNTFLQQQYQQQYQQQNQPLPPTWQQQNTNSLTIPTGAAPLVGDQFLALQNFYQSQIPGSGPITAPSSANSGDYPGSSAALSQAYSQASLAAQQQAANQNMYAIGNGLGNPFSYLTQQQYVQETGIQNPAPPNTVTSGSAWQQWAAAQFAQTGQYPTFNQQTISTANAWMQKKGGGASAVERMHMTNSWANDKTSNYSQWVNQGVQISGGGALHVTHSRQKNINIARRAIAGQILNNMGPALPVVNPETHG